MAKAVLDGLHTGRMAEDKVAAATWLLEGQSPEGWERICERGQIRPSQLAQVLEQLLGPEVGEKAHRWARTWIEEGVEVTPWYRNGEMTAGEAAWLVPGRGSEAEAGGQVFHERGGKRFMVDPQEQDALEARRMAKEMQIPDEVVEAARDGRLRVVLGAGASKAAGLPLYGELARTIGAMGDDVPDEGVGIALDEARMKIPDLNDRMAERLKEHEAKTGHRPSAIHQEAVRLALRCGLDGVYTTNWDTLLPKAWERAQAQEGHEHTGDEEEAAGRCPWDTGGEGSPQVHLLHGSINDPERMLVTEHDLDGWYAGEEGREVIKRLTQRGTILLTVGFRWSDKVVRKMIGAEHRTRSGLEPHIYAICDASGIDREAGWEGGTQAIRYPPGKHGVVPHILRRLTDEAERQPELEAKESIQAIARGGARNATNGDWEAVRAASDEAAPGRLVQFTQEADVDEWLDEKTMRAGLAAGLAGRGNHNGVWTGWVAKNATWKRVAKVTGLTNGHAGQGVGPDTAARLLSALGRAGEPDSADQAALVLWLLEAGGRTNREMLLLHARGCLRCLKRAGCWGVLEAAVQWGIEPRWTGEATIDRHARRGGETGITGNERAYAVEMVWEDVGPGLIARSPRKVAEMVRRALERRQEMLEATGRGTACGASWRRSAVEPHAQDNLPATTADVWTDGLRDSLTALGKVEESEGEWQEEVAKCARSRAPLARRCAIHAVGRSERWSANRKLAWVEAEERRRDRASHHERYELVRRCWPQASEEGKRLFVEGRMSRATEATGEEKINEERGLYDWLTGLARDTGDNGVLAKAAQDMVEKHPEWVPREWSAFTHYTESGPVAHASPWGAEGGLRPDERGVDQVMDWTPGEQRRLGDLDLACGARLAIEKMAKDSPAWGAALSWRLMREDAWTHHAWGPLCQAMEEWTEGDWTKVARKLRWERVASANEGQAHGVCRLARTRAVKAKGAHQATCRVLAMVERTWSALREREMSLPVVDYMSEASNSPDGMALEAVFACIQESVKHAHEAGKAGKKKEAGRAEALRDRCLKALKRLMDAPDNGTHAHGCAAAHTVTHGYWMGFHTPEVVRSYVVDKMGPGKNGEVRKAIRQSLAYVGFHTEGWVDLMRPGLRRELEAWDRNEEERELENIATKWAQGIVLASEWWKEEGKGEGIAEWTLAGIGPEARYEVLTTACRLAAEPSRSPVERARMWARGIGRVAKALTEAGEMKRDHKEAMTRCFAWIGLAGQRELEELCRGGEKLRSTGTFVEEGLEIDRRAAIRLAGNVEAGCSSVGWWQSLEAIQKWTQEKDRLSDPARSLALNILARHGL